MVSETHLLATVLHELRQPLHAALGGLAVVRAHATGEAAVRACDVVERQLEQLARISEDLLDATRIAGGDVALQQEALDVRQVLRTALETMSTELRVAGLEIATKFPADPVHARADAGRLQQVFVNLLSNACRYTPAGGRVLVTVESPGEHVIVTVTDTGEGIAADRLDGIFDLFVRANGRPGGFGIGLAVARSLVEAHGGTITASSDGPGKGSAFTVRLPAARIAPPLAAV